MINLILFGVSYIIFFLLYLIFFYLLGFKRKNIKNSMQFRLLKYKFKLRDKDLNPKKLGFIICLIDPLIISMTGTIVSLPKWNWILEIGIGFILLMALIYSFYEIIGRIIRRKVDKNE